MDQILKDLTSFLESSRWAILWFFLGLGYLFYRKLQKGERAEKELILKNFQDEVKDIEETNHNLSDDELIRKNNSRK